MFFLSHHPVYHRTKTDSLLLLYSSIVDTGLCAQPDTFGTFILEEITDTKSDDHAFRLKYIITSGGSGAWWSYRCYCSDACSTGTNRCATGCDNSASDNTTNGGSEGSGAYLS